MPPRRNSGKDWSGMRIQQLGFLQALMHRGFMLHEDALALLANLVGDIETSEYEELIGEMNRRIQADSFEIRSTLSFTDGKRYVGFVNKDEKGPASKVGSKYTPPQREFFRTLLETIARSGESPELGGAILCSEATSLDPRDQNRQLSQVSSSQQRSYKSKMTRKEMLDTMDRLVCDGWLANTPGMDGFYSIGVRSFLELDKFLLNMDLPERTRTIWTNVL